MVKSCLICKTKGNSSTKSYYRIPKKLVHRSSEVSNLSEERRMKWCQVLNLPFDDDKAEQVRICSEHFISGAPSQLLDFSDPDWIPTLNLHPEKRGTFIISNEQVKPQRCPSKVLLVVCRLCAESKPRKTCVNMFPRKSNENSLKLKTVMKEFLKYSVSEGDQLPKHVCHACVKRLYLCQEWMEGFTKAQEQFVSNQPPPAPEVEQVKSSTVDLHQDKYRRKYIKPAVIKLKKFEEKSCKCGLCFEKFENVEQLLLHKNFCSVYWCTICRPRTMFKTKEEYVKHKRKHTDKQICQVCGKQYSSFYLLKHFKNHFAQFTKCKQCGRMVKNISRHHSDVHQVRTSCVCYLCGGVFKNLKKHMLLHEETSTVEIT